MLAEYFYPHDRGGSEWSTYFLAQSLIKLGHQINVLTPNYGSKYQQNWKNIQISRFSIGKKLNKNQGTLTPLWHTNIYWHFQVVKALIRHVRLNRTDIIHVQGKFFLPIAVIIGKIKKIPVVFTARDYHTICNLGFCLWQRKKSCSLIDFINKDFKFYTLNYLKTPSHIKTALLSIAAFRMRFISKTLRLFAKKCDQVVCISDSQQGIFKTNGFKNTQVIYNSTDFDIKPVKRNNTIVFAGRLTPGKGAHLLIPTFLKLKSKHQLLIIGSGMLRSQINKQIVKHKLSKQIRLLGHIKRSRLLKLLQHSKAALIPSIWPEPFGRVALEAISVGTPVVTSNKGGLPEIVQHKYGISTSPTPKNLAQALKKIISSRKYQNKIKENTSMLKKQFVHQPALQHQSLYYHLLSL